MAKSPSHIHGLSCHGQKSNTNTLPSSFSTIIFCNSKKYIIIQTLKIKTRQKENLSSSMRASSGHVCYHPNCGSLNYVFVVSHLKRLKIILLKIISQNCLLDTDKSDDVKLTMDDSYEFP